MKTATSIKIEGSQKRIFKFAADQAGEDFTEFMVNSAMFRIQNHLLDKKPISPMEAFAQLYLETYSPSKVTKEDAAEIEVLVQKARAGKLSFKKMGTVKVRPPARA